MPVAAAFGTRGSASIEPGFRGAAVFGARHPVDDQRVTDLPSSRACQRTAEVPAYKGSRSTAGNGGRGEGGSQVDTQPVTHRNHFFLPMRGSVDDRGVGAWIVPGRHGVPARRRARMNPARLLMPTSPDRITVSRVDTRHIKTHVTTGITQTRLVMAGECRAVAWIRSWCAGRRLRRRMPERL